MLLDKIIKKYALEWDLERLATIDRNLLRMALFEMIFTGNSSAIVINEVLEIAKIYSSSEAPRFINGIFGKNNYGSGIDQDRTKYWKLRGDLSICLHRSLMVGL